MNGYVRARIDDELKNAAAAVLESVGLSVSDVVRVLLTRIAKEKAIPAELFIPNKATVAAMVEADRLIEAKNFRFDTAREMFDALEKTTGEEPTG